MVLLLLLTVVLWVNFHKRSWIRIPNLLAGLNFPQANGDTLGKADREILLGTREAEPGRENSRIGFTKDDGIGGTHKRAFGWYAGTVDLELEQVNLQYPHVEASENPQEVNDISNKQTKPKPNTLTTIWRD